MTSIFSKIFTKYNVTFAFSVSSKSPSINGSLYSPLIYGNNDYFQSQKGESPGEWWQVSSKIGYFYINKYRKDIKAYWFCDSKETTKHIRSLGYKAYIYKSKIGRAIEKKAGVFVVEMVKEHIPIRMQDVKILNLWHGVGCKSIERKVNFGFLNERIVAKLLKDINSTILNPKQVFDQVYFSECSDISSTEIQPVSKIKMHFENQMKKNL